MTLNEYSAVAIVRRALGRTPEDEPPVDSGLSRTEQALDHLAVINEFMVAEGVVKDADQIILTSLSSPVGGWPGTFALARAVLAGCTTASGDTGTAVQNGLSLYVANKWTHRAFDRKFDKNGDKPFAPTMPAVVKVSRGNRAKNQARAVGFLFKPAEENKFNSSIVDATSTHVVAKLVQKHTGPSVTPLP